MKELIAYIAEALVDHPDEVSVSNGDRGLELHVADEDLGRVIGRRGRTAKSMRTLLRAAGGPNERDLDIRGASESTPE
jgi:predicted RNA-binding protein YlqC (UPF0109 family)